MHNFCIKFSVSGAGSARTYHGLSTNDLVARRPIFNIIAPASAENLCLCSGKKLFIAGSHYTNSYNNVMDGYEYDYILHIYIDMHITILLYFINIHLV